MTPSSIFSHLPPDSSHLQTLSSFLSSFSPTCEFRFSPFNFPCHWAEGLASSPPRVDVSLLGTRVQAGPTLRGVFNRIGCADHVSILIRPPVCQPAYKRRYLTLIPNPRLSCQPQPPFHLAPPSTLPFSFLLFVSSSHSNLLLPSTRFTALLLSPPRRTHLPEWICV